MSLPPVSVTPLGSYRNETPYPFCPGCGHGPILDHLNRALQLCDLDPRRVVLVSDIGCSGLSDQYFATNAFHGLHGRSITYASGIKFANPELTVVVIMGDGGTGIGGTHIISAARRNVGITVLVFNNFNFGMTGGQHSATTPAGGVTSTTPGGSLELPLDICATVAANGASYVYRGTSFDPDLPERIAAAIRCDGFGLLDIWELCTAYYVPRNALSRKALGETMTDLGLETGVLAERARPEYSRAWREANAACRGEPTLPSLSFEARFLARLEAAVRYGSPGDTRDPAARCAPDPERGWPTEGRPLPHGDGARSPRLRAGTAGCSGLSGDRHAPRPRRPGSAGPARTGRPRGPGGRHPQPLAPASVGARGGCALRQPG